MRLLSLVIVLAVCLATSPAVTAQPHRHHHHHWHNRPPVSVYVGGFYGPPPPVAYYAPYPRYGGYYYGPSVAVQITKPAPVVRVVEAPRPPLASPPPPPEPLPRPLTVLPPNPDPQVGQAIRLINPRENGVTITYGVGDRIKTLVAGQDTVTYVAGPTDVVFSRGRDLGQRRYTLEGGTYEFRHLGLEGWDLLPLQSRTPGPTGVKTTPTPLPGLAAPLPAPTPTETVIPGLPPLPAP